MSDPRRGDQEETAASARRPWWAGVDVAMRAVVGDRASPSVVGKEKDESGVRQQNKHTHSKLLQRNAEILHASFYASRGE